MNFQKVLLLGPAITKYTFSVIVDDVKTHNKLTTVLKFANHKELQNYLTEEIKGNELLIFKASQSLVFEGFIEALLKNKNDIQKLPRREIAWDTYRANKGF